MHVRIRFALPVCAAVVCLGLLAHGSHAHGGPPLRLGVTADPAVSAVARLALVHLRDGVGYAVDWREFPDERALRDAYARGKLDIAVAVLAAGGVSTAGGCGPEGRDDAREGLRRQWAGETFVLGFPFDAAACSWAGLIVSRAVLDDLRFGILGKEAARLSTLVTAEDVAAVRAAAARGGDRAATAAARAALAAKAGR